MKEKFHRTGRLGWKVKINIVNANKMIDKDQV